MSQTVVDAAEEIAAGSALMAGVTQRLRAFVFISHHRTYRLALLQQQLGDRAPYPADARPAAPVARMGLSRARFIKVHNG